MTHPILRSDDRFRRPEPVDEEGRNRFRELSPEEALSAVAGSSTSESATPEPSVTSDNTPVYLPHYEHALPHRARSISWLASCGLLLSLCLGATVLGWVAAWYGMIFGLLGVMICLVSAMQAYGELQGIAAGAIDSSGRDRLVIAWCAAMCGIVCGLAMMLWGVVLLMYGALDLYA